MNNPALPHLGDSNLIVRLATPADATAILAFHLTNRAVFAPVEPRRPENFYTLEFCQMRIAMNRSHFTEGRSACLFVFEPDNTTVIGTVNFTNIAGYPYHGATLGYSLDHRHWGQGRMQAALQLALDWVFADLNLHRVCANHLPDNTRSARLLAKLGFVREGYAANYLLIDGVWRDHVLTALTHHSWQSRDHTANLLVNPGGADLKDQGQ